MCQSQVPSSQHNSSFVTNLCQIISHNTHTQRNHAGPSAETLTTCVSVHEKRVRDPQNGPGEFLLSCRLSGLVLLGSLETSSSSARNLTRLCRAAFISKHLLLSPPQHSILRFIWRTSCLSRHAARPARKLSLINFWDLSSK